ncbi:SGNH/GDSL hydrolase family protein [Peterkaempfera bronchialis]|uniref:SGNH/GDSL hydrolase family protein n=1 Tax=Peterkaempfera bronchialis TaxID=2126346 RepID=A0A345SUS1_9ACTN|nr:SGNH/GDSL hydrolase family protein [Peterkaempfera bronchialis]AXI77476.1 SGNH/GDSL hydrolase family protein [Peterkaempfera bronchialis]
MQKKDLRTAAGALAATGALLLTAACSGGGGSQAGPAKPAPVPVATTAPSPGSGSSAGPYAALGDSYTSGPRIPTQAGTPLGCDRSDRNYPSLVAKALGLTGRDFRDVSCSGATTANLAAPQSTSDGVNPPQLAALSTRTRLVTLSIGGNDVGFVALLSRCVQAGVLRSLGLDRSAAPSGDAPCKDFYTASGHDELGQRVQTAGRRLAAGLAEVRQRAPLARVFVVGYPALVPESGAACPSQLGLAAGDVAFLHDEEQRLNTELRQRAEAAGARYVDTWTPSLGHDACTAEAVRWIEPLSPAAPAAPAHPNERGERGMADAVLRAVRGPF